MVSRDHAHRFLNYLKVDWQVVDQRKVRAGSQEGEDTGCPDTALLEQARHEQRAFVHVPLVDDEGDGQDNEADQRADHVAVIPQLAGAAPLHREEVAQDRADDENHARDIHLQDLFLEWRRNGHRCLGRFEEKDEDGRGRSAEGQVDPEAPSPAQVLCENTAKERTGKCRNGIGTTHDAHVDWLIRRRCGESDHDERSRGHTSPASALKSTAKDQRRAILCNGADDAADLEHKNGDQIRPLERKVFICFAPNRLEGGHGEEECTAIPSDSTRILLAKHTWQW